VLLAAASLAGCNDKSKSAAPPVPSSSGASAPTSATSTPASSVTPQSSDVPVSPSAAGSGPGQGGTAVGGMVGQQEKNGKAASTPAPTGGDAAPSK